MAERFRAPAERLVVLPSELDPRDASIVEPAAVSWHALRLAGAGPHTRVAVVGAGGLGLLAVAGAFRQGAQDVSVEARHPFQKEAAERLGAQNGLNGLYDVVIEAAGTAESLARCVDLVAPGGRIVVLGLHTGAAVSIPWLPLFMREAAVIPSIGYCAHPDGREMDEAAAMLAADPAIIDTIVTHRFALEDAVEAFRVAADKSSGAIRVVCIRDEGLFVRGSDLYHIGIVVPQLEEAMAQLSESLGLVWGPIIDSPAMPVVHPESGTTSSPAPRIVFSVDAPHIELIQEIPGSVWVCNPYSNLHHIGFWGAGLHPEASRLVGTGCPIELMGLGPEEGVPTTMTYHRLPLGIRVEVIDKALSEGPGSDVDRATGRVVTSPPGLAAVTGAGRGLGRAVALELAARGFDVLATMRDPASGESLLKEAASLPGQLELAQLDITNPKSFVFPAGLAVLVNNAGVRLSYLPVEHSPEEEWRQTFETNVFGLEKMLRRAIPVMRDAGGGVICNVTSAAILTPVPFFSVYRASKAAASAICDSLAVEVAPFGIRVLEILPGPIDTELLRTSALYRPLDAVNYQLYESMAAQSVGDPSTSVVTSAADAAKAIVDAITAEDGDLRQGCDPVSRMLLENWRTRSDQELLEAMQARYAGAPAFETESE